MSVIVHALATVVHDLIKMVSLLLQFVCPITSMPWIQ